MKRSRSFHSGTKNFIIGVALFLLGVGVLTRLTDYTRTVQELSCSAFLDAVEKDSVAAVSISGAEVHGVLKDGGRFVTKVADPHQHIAVMRAHHVDFSFADTAQVTFWHIAFGLFFLLAMAIVWFMLRQSRNAGNGGGPGGIFSISKARAKMVMPSMIKENFGSVAGAREAKSELQDIVDFLKNPEKYRKAGARIPRGVLLIGEPGNGKTLLARAVAGEANCPFFSITGSDFIEVFVGVGAARVRDLFAQARKQAPCIVFIDEIDAIGRQRGAGFGGGHDEREQTLNQLLTEMDGFDGANSHVIVIAATNMPEVLDKALLRPGRFDRRIIVPFPDEESRRDILMIHARALTLAPDADLSVIARDTAGFSGADLGNLMNLAAVQASKADRDTVTMADLTAAHQLVVRSRSSGNVPGVADVTGGGSGRLYVPSQVKTKFSDVAGLLEAKEELQDIVDFLKNPEKYTRLGARVPRGILLSGEPGNGKTLLAKAVAGEANCPFFQVSGSEFIEKYVGVGAARIRELFAQARRHTPSIIFIDEIDAIGGHRASDDAGGGREHAQTLNQLLTELDGFATEPGAIVIIGATNRPDMLDSALMRPGRFDRQVRVTYPDTDARVGILEVHARNIKLEPGVDLRIVARSTPGFSGAQLEAVINEAAIEASKNNQEFVTLKDLDNAVDKVMLGKKWKNRTRITPEDLKVTAYHEAGHALINLLLPEESDPLYKVTIVPQGGALGVAHRLPERDRVSESKARAEAFIMIALAGRLAEEMLLGRHVTGGAQNDFEQASATARKMVCVWGMSEKLGPVTYDPRQFSYSQKTAELIDDEVRAIVDRSRVRAQELLVQNRDKLEKLVQALLEKETLFAAEIYELLEISPRESFKVA